MSKVAQNLIGMACVAAGLIYFTSSKDKASVSADPASIQRVASPETAKPSAFDLSPSTQSEFIEILDKYRKAHASAHNEMSAGGQRPARARALCENIKSRQVENWTGYITKLSTNGDGNGVILVAAGPGITIGTTNNSFTDASYRTLIDPQSKLFETASSMKVGDPVRFSGRFFPDQTDCLREMSVTLRGSMSEPQFIFRFSAISRLDGAAQLRRKSMLKQLLD